MIDIRPAGDCVEVFDAGGKMRLRLRVASDCSRAKLESSDVPVEFVRLPTQEPVCVPEVVENKPTPRGAEPKPCVRCGWCCRLKSCGFGKWNFDKDECSELASDGQGKFRCGIYDMIVAYPEECRSVDPGFGKGCLTHTNPDRKVLEGTQ
jgi:hypothetical protein